MARTVRTTDTISRDEHVLSNSGCTCRRQGHHSGSLNQRVRPPQVTRMALDLCAGIWLPRFSKLSPTPT